MHRNENNLPDGYVGQPFVKTKKDRDNERRNREIRETHAAIERLYYSIQRRKPERTALSEKLDAVLDSMPKHTPDTPHVEEPVGERRFMYFGVHLHKLSREDLIKKYFPDHENKNLP